MKKDIQQLLQECLEGYDGGLTPEECLSAYPAVRAELEPLFRQAISLRVAYAASPRAEFRFQAREKLLFAAGRDVVKALSADPLPDFVSTTRQRLLNRAGAGAQEALRDVPPPRLPFWVNARRHLLETAASAPPKPAPAMAFGLRSAISAAVVVFAVAIAGLGFFLQNSPANQPRSALSAQLDAIQKDLNTYEQLRANGEAVSASWLEDLASRTSQLAEQYSEASPNAELIEKLPDLIDRQQSLLAEADSRALVEAQQRLDEADQRFTAAAAQSPEPEPTSTPEDVVATAPTPEPTEEPTEEPTLEPTPTQEIVVPTVDVITSTELGPRQLVMQLAPEETALNTRWWRVTTNTLTFIMPESWEILGLGTDENGLTVLQTDAILIQTDVNDLLLVVSTADGSVETAIDGQPFTLREGGPDGLTLAPDDLAQLTDATDNWAFLWNMLAEIELVAGASTPTPDGTTSPSSTATPNETPPPSATATEAAP